MRYLLTVLILLFIFSELPAYFQQEVKYHIDVELLHELNRLEGLEKITYINNSPDSLSILFFHLYINKFKNFHRSANSSRQSFGYQEIIYLQDNDGHDLEYEIQGTVMKIILDETVCPADSVLLTIRFNTVLPEAGERFGHYGDHFDVGNWYPVPAVYDSRGWHTDQHYDGEFYQEWGNFQVNITVPAGFVVGASGVLLNQDALPDSVESADRKKYYEYSEDSAKVIYRYTAPHVHDFAWTADPEYIVRTTMVEGTELRFLILPYGLKDWESQLEIAAKAVALFNRQIGPYPYATLTVADGYVKAGGIEYPNIVIINDQINDSMELSATIIHEIAHQWFYGLIANNQTSYGWMDEGFATFFESQGMAHLFGNNREYVNSPRGFWGKFFGYWRNRENSDRLAYLEYIRSGEEEPIFRHFDWFRHEPWIPYYQKMSLVISQLRYLTGDSLFWRAIHNYYEKWKYRHPYPEDLYQVFEDISGRELDWFFYQWLNTTWHCDYSVHTCGEQWQTVKGEKLYQARLKFKRNDQIAMPLDFRVHFKNGSIGNYRISVDDGMSFMPPDSLAIPPWSFREKVNYVTLNLPDRISKVEINPGQQLLDINPFNDDTGRWPGIYWYWLKRQYYLPHTDGYTATVFPFLFYNHIDGLQAGIRTRGNYIFPDYQHRSEILLGFRSWHPSLDIWFEHPFYRLNRDVHIIANLYNAAGRRGTGLWLQWITNNRKKVNSALFGWQWRYIYNMDYYPYPVSAGNISFLEGEIKKGYWKAGFLPAGWQVSIKAETSFLGGDYSFQTWQIRGLTRLPLPFHQKLTLSLTSENAYGTPPLQKAFRIGGSGLYDYFLNPYLRARGTLPPSWWSQDHVFQEGGGNIRSLASAWEPAPSHLINGFVSITLGNPLNLSYQYFPYLSDILISAFTSWTTTGNNWNHFSDYYGEAGLTVSFTRLPFVLTYFDIETLHLDFPFWVNNTIGSENIDYRWVIRMDIRSFN